MPHILVVDDDAALLALTQSILSDDGHDVDTAANGAEALAMLKAHCRQKYPGLPFTIMSGGDDLGQLDALARAGILGAQETLYKPFNKADLLGAVERCLHPKAI
jgi:DNA-binding NtrC family response regulator